MDFKNILNDIEQAGPQVYEQVSGRRQLLKSCGSKVAVAALPFAIGSLFTEASAKTTATDAVAAYNFALELEYLAYNYYRTGNNTGGLIPGAYKAGFLAIEEHKKAHVNFLIAQVVALGGTPYTPKNYNPAATNPLYIVSGAYDFTAGGKYDVFSKFADFVMVSEVFEDTFVHCYKGQFNELLGDVVALEILMKLQSATARDAGHARFVRRELGYAQAPEHPAPWITDNIPPAAAFQAYYNGEENVIQMGGVNISGLSGSTGQVAGISATAAFDEALDKVFVLDLLAQFRIK